ncbi:MAG: AraC family transcriptional regulator [Rhizonema sp. PD38]|nr:AraC family transcriptional regulator [Rhizonema sp. PD38]
MPKQSLAIDFHQEKASEQILPRIPLLSSHKAGWDNIHLEYHRQAPLSIPEHFLEQHLVCICLSDSVIVEHAFDGCFLSEHLTVGNCTIIPAHVQHRANCNRHAEFVLLSLEPTFLDRAALELTDNVSLELVPQFSSEDPLIHQIGLALKTDLQSGELGSRLYADSMAHALSFHLIRHYTTSKQTVVNYTDGLPKYKLRQAIDYIINHLNQEISLTNLASVVQMSPFHFARLFKQSTGTSPHQFVTHLRIDKAKQLLTTQDLEVIDVSQQVGFKNQSHFSAVFRKVVGIAPKAYRDMYK